MNLGTLVRERLIDPVRRAQGSPVSIARGTALGLWISFTPTVGIQMFLVTAIGIPLKANLPIAIALVWLSNPVTIIPLYYSYYWLGAVLLGEGARGYGELTEVLLRPIRAIEDGSTGFLDSLGLLGGEVLVPLMVGSVVVATALAIPGYHVALRMATRRLARRLEEEARAAAVEAGGQPAPPAPVVEESRRP